MESWIKLHVSILDSPKVMTLSDSGFRLWALCLAFARRNGEQGALPTVETLAFALRVDEPKMRAGIAEMSSKGLLEPRDGGFMIQDWTHWQTTESESAKRVRAFRERRKGEALQALPETDVTLRNVTCNAVTDVTTEEKRREEKRLEEISAGADSAAVAAPPEPKQRKPKAAFVPPTLPEVQAYCRERRNSIDAEAFLAHYTANGWRQSGGNLIRNWKAAVVTWEKNETRRWGLTANGSQTRITVPSGVMPPPSDPQFEHRRLTGERVVREAREFDERRKREQAEAAARAETNGVGHSPANAPRSADG